MSTKSPSKEKTELTEYEKEVLIFFAKAFASEISKIIMFALIFNAVGLLPEFWSSLFFLMLYRTSSGGLHCKTYWGCFALSFSILLASILLGGNVFPPLWLIYVSSMMMCFVAYKLSPIQAATRPPLEEHLKLKAKKRTVFSIIIFLIILTIQHLNVYTNIGFWLLVLHIVQLIIANKIRR